MSYIVVNYNEVPPSDVIAFYPEVNAEGEVYDWWMIDLRNPGDVIYADTFKDLSLAISRGSSDDSTEEKMNARIRFGLDAMVFLKNQLKNYIKENSTIEVQRWEGEVIATSLQYPRDCVYGWGDGNNRFFLEDIPSRNVEFQDVWNSRVPLILFELNYAPYTPLKAPISGYSEEEYTNLKWIRVSSEYEFLTSLEAEGLIEYGRTLE